MSHINSPSLGRLSAHFTALLTVALLAFAYRADESKWLAVPTLPDCAPCCKRLNKGASKNNGRGNQEWAAVGNRDVSVCAIVFTGTRAAINRQEAERSRPKRPYGEGCQRGQFLGCKYYAASDGSTVSLRYYN